MSASAFPLARVPREAEKPAKVTRARVTTATIAVVTVVNPITAGRLALAQELGKPLRCAYRNGRLQVWTEEAK